MPFYYQPPLSRPQTLAADPSETGACYASVETPVESILEQDPTVIAFGEIHPERNFSYETTQAIFAQRILPLMANAGICDLVVESIYNDPEIEQDLEVFYETGTLDAFHTPFLSYNISTLRDSGALTWVLYLSRESGVRVHGGGMSIAVAQETILSPYYPFRDDLKSKVRISITQSLIGKAFQLLAQGKRIAIYSGARHNNICPTTNDLLDGVNFGTTLADWVGYSKYYEVDLILPYRLEFINSSIRVPNWEEMVPFSGVNVLERGNNYTIFFPW